MRIGACFPALALMTRVNRINLLFIFRLLFRIPYFVNLWGHAGETDIDEDVEVQDIGGKWRKVYDENSGNHYYYHVDTHETTWTMPPEWDNKLLMNHQDELAKARASSLIMSQSNDDFSLPQLLSPHQSSGFARYSTADESSEEEEDVTKTLSHMVPVW